MVLTIFPPPFGTTLRMLPTFVPFFTSSTCFSTSLFLHSTRLPILSFHNILYTPSISRFVVTTLPTSLPLSLFMIRIPWPSFPFSWTITPQLITTLITVRLYPQHRPFLRLSTIAFYSRYRPSPLSCDIFSTQITIGSFTTTFAIKSSHSIFTRLSLFLPNIPPCSRLFLPHP